MTKIYVVMGQTGEYSDHHSWPVCAYASEEDAERHAVAAAARALRIKREDDARDHTMRWDKGWIAEQMGGLDPDIRMDYTGTDYYVLTVEMREGFHG